MKTKGQKGKKGRSLKVLMLSMLIPLILIGQIASGKGAIFNMESYGKTILDTDLNNGCLAGLQALDSYFWGIEYRMATMSMTGIIQDDVITGDFKGTKGLLTGLKGANDVITGTVFRSEGGDNVIVPVSVDYKGKGMTSVIEDEYYKEAKEKEVVWVGPYDDKLTGEKTLSVYRSVKDSRDRVIGVIGMNINFHDISQYFCEREFSKTGYSIMLSPDGTVLSNRADMSKVYSKTEHPDLLQIAAETGESIGEIKINGGEYKYKACDIPRTDWRMVSLISMHENDKVLGRSKWMQLGIMLAVIAFSVAVVWIIVGKISKRLQELKLAMNKAGGGDLTSAVKLKHEAEKKMDELDVIGDSYNTMMRDFGLTLEDTKATLGQLLDQNNTLNDAFARLNGSSSNITNTMTEVAEVSEEQANNTTAVVEETNELSSNIEAVSSLVGEMKDSCIELEEKTDRGLDIVNRLVSTSGDTLRAANEITVSIGNVDESSKEIENIIGLINSVADQTNLLALNASIEAARAGEAGKGFAVVADEIRKLAEQSQEATANIRSIINKMQEKITETVQAVDDVNNVMNEQSDSVKETEESFKDIALDVQGMGALVLEVGEKNTVMVEKKESIFASMTDLSAGIEETSASTQEVTGHARDQAKIVTELSNMTGEITEYSQKLSDKLNHFICK